MIKKIAGKVVHKILYLTEKPRKSALQSYYGIAGSKVECNTCHYKTHQLNSDKWHLYATCPVCRSTVRQRLLWASLTSPHKKSTELNYQNLIQNTLFHCS